MGKIERLLILYFAGIFVAHAQLFSVTDLGTLGGSNSAAYAINNSGQITGFSSVIGFSDSFIYSGGTMTALAVEDQFSAGRAINSAGDVVGRYGHFGPYASQAYLYSGGVVTLLPLDLAFGINDSGDIVGTDSSARGILYSGGISTDIGDLGGSFTAPYAINNAGQIVGSSYVTGDASSRAFSYSGGIMTDLGTLGGNNSTAYAVNASGTIIVGEADTGTSSRAFSYSGGSMTDLGTLGGANSASLGINSSGTIVGWANDAGGASHAFYTLAGTLIDLNTVLDASGSGWILQSATAINDSGYIVGYGTIGGSTRAFLLTPIPEPSTWACLIAGMGLLCAINRRRLK